MTIVSTSTSAFYERARSDMTSLRIQGERLQAQVGGQTRLTKSSDDPVAASRLRNLARANTLSQIDNTNANRASADLSLADSAMSDITNAIAQAKVLATQAATGTVSADQRAAIGKELAMLHSTIIGLINTRDSNGHALFGGEGAMNAYTLNASGNAVYSGTASSGELPLGDGQSVTRSMTGQEFLNFTVAGQPTDLMITIKTLSDALQSGVGDPAGAAGNALEAFSAGLDKATTAQTVIGTRLAWIELTTERRTTMNEARASEQADIGGVDFASSVAKLQELMVVLQASQATFTKMAQLSLFNQLR